MVAFEKEKSGVEQIPIRYAAVLRINEILSRNPALAENVLIKLPTILVADEIAAECRVLAEYYEKRAESGD